MAFRHDRTRPTLFDRPVDWQRVPSSDTVAGVGVVRVNAGDVAQLQAVGVHIHVVVRVSQIINESKEK